MTAEALKKSSPSRRLGSMNAAEAADAIVRHVETHDYVSFPDIGRLIPGLQRGPKCRRLPFLWHRQH